MTVRAIHFVASANHEELRTRLAHRMATFHAVAADKFVGGAFNQSMQRLMIDALSRR